MARNTVAPFFRTRCIREQDVIPTCTAAIVTRKARSRLNTSTIALTTRYTTHTGQLSLAIPSCVGAKSTSQRAVIPCSWGVKAGMVRVWVAGKTV